jgi:nucleoside-diphosphate-sugar epimerase
MNDSPPAVSSTPTGSRRPAAVLITGAGGEVGHGLIEALAAQGREAIVAIDIRELEPELRSKCSETFVGDICDPLLLGRLLAMYEITEIYHLAALLSTRSEYAPESAHDVNVGGTLNLLRLAAEQARSHGRKVKFIYPSSIAVYGMPDLQTKAKAGAVGEDEYLQPTTMYGCNKLYGEHLGRYYSRHYRQLAQDRTPDVLDFRCVRYPGLISPHTVPSGGTSDFGPEMIHAAATGKAYKCFVRESARIPFMTMGEAIDATLALGAADPGRLKRCVYNIGAFSPSAGEFADAVREAFPGAEIRFEPDVQRQAIVDSWPEEVDWSAATRDWDYKPGKDFKRAFEEDLLPPIRARYVK